MKRAWLIPAAGAALVLYLTFTGFQCGSSEMTTAKLAYSQKNLDKADSSFMKEVEKNPVNGEAWYYLGRVRLEKGNYAGMAEAYKQSLSVTKEFEPKIIDDKKYVWGVTLNQGVNFFNRSQILRNDPAKKDSADLYLQRSIDAYKMALVVNPDSVITYQNMAVAQHVSGNYDDEIATLQKAISIKKDSKLSSSLINAYIQKAEDAKKTGKTAESAEAFNQAIAALTAERAANPGDEELIGTLINLYIEAGRTKDALPLIKEAVEKDPKNKVYQNDLGLLLLDQGNTEEAIAHFDAAVATDSTYDQALRNGAVAYMKLGAKMKEHAEAKSKGKGETDKSYISKFKKAVTLLEKLTSLKPDNADFLEALASAYGNAGMFKQAEAAIKKVDVLRGK
jgi:tetratricopeptide (TPR) repeat protein